MRYVFDVYCQTRGIGKAKFAYVCTITPLEVYEKPSLEQQSLTLFS